MIATPSGVAILFDDLTEFFSLRQSIDELIKQNISVDIYVSSNYSKTMKQETRNLISDLGYDVKSSFDKSKRYKILLEPYPLIEDGELDFEFRIKYRYAPVSVKPNPVCTPEWNILYDAFIVYSKRDADIFSVYGKSHIVRYSKFDKFKKEIKNNNKPNLLYLPTFGDIGSIEDLDEKVIQDLKQTYSFTIKAHHAIQFRSDEKNNYKKIKRVADKFYESDTPLLKLLEKADIVLSDNSSAIFDAIYAEVPVAIISDKEKLNQKKLGALNTYQYELVKRGLIPCAETSAQIPEALKRAQNLAVKQKKIKNEIFALDLREIDLQDFTDIIKHYLTYVRENDLFFVAKDILTTSWRQRIALQVDEDFSNRLIRENERLQKTVDSYEQSISWRATKPLRVMHQLARGKK